MEYAVKKEADSIVEIYRPKTTIEYMGDWIDDMPTAIKCAIQDRQSVLDRCKVHYQLVKENMKSTLQRAMVCSTITKEIHSLNQQINYLKSKI